MTVQSTVSSFSLTLKTWGYVIVDSLHPIYPSSLAWKRLVLPQETKEMLKAVTASTLRGINKVDGGCSDDNEEFKNDVETKKALKLLEKSTRQKPYDIVDSNMVHWYFFMDNQERHLQWKHYQDSMEDHCI